MKKFILFLFLIIGCSFDKAVDRYYNEAKFQSDVSEICLEEGDSELYQRIARSVFLLETEGEDLTNYTYRDLIEYDIVRLNAEIKSI